MLLLEALAGTNRSARPPLWLMRQAGRYMHEYQALRHKFGLMTLFHTPELIAEVTLLPITAFDFDAAIIFSDILLIAQAFGLTLAYEEGRGPLLNPVLTPGDIQTLRTRADASCLEVVLQGIRQVKPQLQVPLIGFAGAPFTVASYMIEGQSSSTLPRTKKWLFEDPDTFAELLDILAEHTISYLNAQIEAGVDVIQLFDSWAGMLAPHHFEACSLRVMHKIMKGLKKPCPVILFCKGPSLAPAALQPQAVSLDTQIDLREARMRVGHTVALQGNLDPDVLLTTPAVVKREAGRILRAMQGDPGFIFNLGHGILPTTPRQNVEALVECVKHGYPTA